MSTFTIKHLPDYLSILATVSEEYVPRLHQAEIVDEMLPILDASPNRMWIILDFTLMKLTLDDFLHATDESVKGTGVKVAKHPKCKACLIVSPNRLWHITARGLRSDAFGHLTVYAYDTIDEALANIRERLPSQIPTTA
jgi:hypothetical protein